MADKVPMYHPDFNGDINGFSRRGVLTALNENRYVLETPTQRFMKKFKWVVMLIMIGALLIASTSVVSRHWLGNTMYDAGVKDAYKAKNGLEHDKRVDKIKEITVREVK